MLIDERRGSSAKPGVPFQILPALRNEGGRKRRWRPRLRPHPPRSTDGRGGGGGEKEEDALSARPTPPPMQRGIGPPIAVGGAPGGIQTRPDNMEIHTV